MRDQLEILISLCPSPCPPDLAEYLEFIRGDGPNERRRDESTGRPYRPKRGQCRGGLPAFVLANLTRTVLRAHRARCLRPGLRTPSAQ